MYLLVTKWSFMSCQLVTNDLWSDQTVSEMGLWIKATYDQGSVWTLQKIVSTICPLLVVENDPFFNSFLNYPEITAINYFRLCTELSRWKEEHINFYGPVLCLSTTSSQDWKQDRNHGQAALTKFHNQTNPS